jgi:tRNA threonylcarbamoyladenosine biosynthesis protein TsaB
MTALGVDTATEVLSLSAAGTSAWGSIAIRRGLQHSPTLLSLVERLLAETGMTASDVQLLVCSLGPGSFTGIRIGLSTVLGISHATGAPVVGVSTLDALAEPWLERDGDTFPVIDARKGRIYTAQFAEGERRGEYLDATPGRLRGLVAAARQPLLVGPDAERIRGILGLGPDQVRVSSLLDPMALLRIGMKLYTTEGADPSRLRPLYLRKSEAEIASGM